MKTVAHYRADREKKATAAMTGGTATHAATLEPEVIGTKIILAPRCQCTAITKKGTQCSKQSVPGSEHCGTHDGAIEAEMWERSLPEGTVIVPEDVMDEAREASAAIRAQLVRFGLGDLPRVWQTEVPFFATARLTDEAPGYIIEPEGGPIEVRCKIDFMAGSPVSIVGDLKRVARGVDERTFRSVAKAEGYHVQAALYVDIVKAHTGIAPPWFWIAHEAVKPWGTIVHEASEADLDKGRKRVNVGLRRWAEYFATGDQWAGWPTEIKTVELPHYQEDDEEE